MKTCTKCRTEKPLEEFRKSSRAKDGHQSWCKTCAYTHHRAYYTNNKERWRVNEQRSIERARAYIVSVFASGCVDCDTKDVRVLQFDHVNGDKLFNVSEMMKRGLGAIKREIAKCEVVCANCHCIRTYSRSGSWRNNHAPLV